MNTTAIHKFRNKLSADQPVYGLWVTLESPSITEMAVALGLDWIVIDAEHGHLDWGDIIAHLRAAARSDTVALVRISELNGALIKRALDIGADGVIVPWIESARQLRQAVAFAHYPPEGVRGIGAERATAWGQCSAEHVAEANQHVLVIPLIETVTAGKNIKAMVQVPGVELFFFGPADYSSTAGYPGQWEGPGIADKLLAIKNKIRTAHKHCGVVAAGADNLRKRGDEGFRMLGLGLDSGLLLSGLHAALAVAGRDRKILPTLAPSPEMTNSPMARPPEGLRPDRPEVMTQVGSGVIVELAPGVQFECLVGLHNQARRLTTGLAHFNPGSRLPRHRHSFSESITVVEGRGIVEVEGRGYELETLDNIIIPRGLAHSALNQAQAPAVFHVAMATSNPTREWVKKNFRTQPMPTSSRGCRGAEYVTRIKTARRYEAGPNTSFIDYFNGQLAPGIEMSGGYGQFQHGGRLPAHLHDFDESITIIQGQATCIVEGRRYAISDNATALQPRGRVHYFVNESSEPMAMIWVYAGPTAERIVVDERCATAEGDPWK